MKKATQAAIEERSTLTGDVVASEGDLEVIRSIIECCTASLATDYLTGGTCCEYCQRPQSGTQADMWEPIGRSDTYWIRNTLRSIFFEGIDV